MPATALPLLSTTFSAVLAPTITGPVSTLYIAATGTEALFAEKVVIVPSARVYSTDLAAKVNSSLSFSVVGTLKRTVAMTSSATELSPSFSAASIERVLVKLL